MISFPNWETAKVQIYVGNVNNTDSVTVVQSSDRLNFLITVDTNLNLFQNKTLTYLNILNF